MNDHIMFNVPGAPQGKGRARTFRANGVTRTVTPTKTVLYENLIKSCYWDQVKKEIYFPESDTPLEITLYVKFAPAKSVSKKKREEMLHGSIAPTKKPDADNIAKAFLDAMNGTVYHDDSQVVALHIYKVYADQPGVEVFVKRWMK